MATTLTELQREVESEKNAPIYRVEEALLPVQHEELCYELPKTVDFSRVIQNIMKALTFLKDSKGTGQSRYEKWLRFLKISENKMVISDLFWLTTLTFFLTNHPDADKHEAILETRIAKNYINFLIRVDDKFEGDKFFKRYFDILAQAVFYSLFYAFPKSRNRFNDELKHKLIEFYSEKFTGIKISNSFVYYDKWCLDLGAGNIFKMERNRMTNTAANFRTDGVHMPVIKRCQKYVRYSPIVAQYLENFQYKTKNYLKEYKMKITEYQANKHLEQKFNVYVNKVNTIKNSCSESKKSYIQEKQNLNKEIKCIKKETATHQHRLEKRKMDEREKGTNEYANYLVSMLNSGINIEPNKNKY